MKAKAVNGYAPDEAANDDLARLFFQHNAIVDGVVRTGRVIGSGRSFAAIQLAELSARADAAADDTDPASILEALPAEGEHDGSRELIVVARKAILLGVARDEFPSVAARWNAKRAKPWDEDDLLRRYDDARARWEAEGARRPIVQLHPSRLEPTIRETMRLLAARGDMFDGPGGELVHVHEAKARAAGSDALIGLMDRTVQFVKPSREGPVPVVPSKLIADQILACFDRPFPPLAGIVRRPFLRDDGSDSAPGYDASTGLIFAPRPGVTYPEIPERPTLKDVLEAFERMLEPL
ncbi:hypothetical protein L6R52_27125, partial [Myxococcota bacterium]|nr:hypothetical protein [Myxococcota bacterium]